jgi:hypothetical protein
MRLLFFLLLLTVSAPAQETLIRQVLDAPSDTRVEVVALFDRPASDGYFPVRVKIANNQDRMATIRLDFQASSNWDGSLRCSSSFRFEALPGKTVTRDVMVPQTPVAGSFGRSLSLRTELSGSMGSASHHLSTDYDPTQPSVLLSEPLFTPNASKLDAEISSRLSGTAGSSSLKFGSKFTASMLPDNWLAYSGFDRIIMLDSDWTSAPAGARTAITSWIRLGGGLTVYSTGDTSTQALGLPSDTGFGTVTLTKLPQSAVGPDNMITLEAFSTINTVIGSRLTTPRRVSLERDYLSSWPLQSKFGNESFRYGLFIVILIIFGILVGPINLFVFAKSGSRHRLFITTPIISLGASALLVVLIIFQDGFGGRGIRTALVEISENMAYLQQEQLCRTGVLTRSSFTIDPAVLVTPAQLMNSPWARYTQNNTKGTFNLQPSDGKLSATGDWFQSRSESGHVIAAAIPTRGRIERASSGDRLVSTFDFPIRKLFYLDPSGNWFRAESIRTGNAFSLTPVNEALVEPEVEELSRSLSSRNQSYFNKLRGRKGHFIAVASSGPIIDTHPGIRWNNTQTILTGAVVAP